MLYERILRPILFRTWNDPESAHEFVMKSLTSITAHPVLRKTVESLCMLNDRRLERELFGLRFRNPIGLAAGFDKNGVAIPALEAFGFGFLEIGTVTRHPQPGNPKPRVFRYPRDEAIINRLGFNNDGADGVAANLGNTARRSDVPLGISIGKSRITPQQRAIEDYVDSLGTLHRYGDYFAVNVSSPNTPDLRKLQEPQLLDELLAALTERAQALAPNRRRKPLLVKIAPDLESRSIDELLQVCEKRSIDGLIAVNTTLARQGLRASSAEEGGLSGRPLLKRALEVVRQIRTNLPQIPIIGVGGITSTDAALQMLDAGADLIQIYTGLVYHGPSFVRQINRHILSRL